MPHNFKDFPELTNSQMQVYYFESPHKQITESFRAKVIKVTDGDTIRVEADFRDFDFPIRFLNTAAPERKEAGGIESQKWLEALVLNQEVDIIIDTKNRVGKWGRLLGEIFFLGRSINEESMNTGHSVRFDQRKQSMIPDFNKELETIKW